MGKGNSQSGRLPKRFIPIGGEVERYGNTFVCVEAPPVETLQPYEACRGCWFARTRRDDGLAASCAALQCSKFDRKDGRNVWFVLKEYADGAVK